MTRDFILSNTFAQIERAMIELSDQGTGFEFECYDVGHLYNLAHFVEREWSSRPSSSRVYSAYWAGWGRTRMMRATLRCCGRSVTPYPALPLRSGDQTAHCPPTRQGKSGSAGQAL